jgi:hypothetical protein
MRTSTWLVLAAVAALVVLLGLFLRMLSPAGRPSPGGPDGARAEEPTPSAFVGAAGCSARACHGGPDAPGDGPGPGESAAYTRWLTRDRHADAYWVLFKERSERMVFNLAGGEGPPRAAHQDDRCLACHTVPATVYDPDRWGRVAQGPEVEHLRRDGVGCEACHGPARRWLAPHATAAWQAPGARPTNYLANGMTWLNDPVVRADVCAGCHVGRAGDKGRNLPPRDVPHDLIAAGHPRLNFEMTSFLRALPPHWAEKDRTRDDASRPPAFTSRLWLAGQLVTARAEFELLRCRPGPGIELAEHDCYACHHGLREPSWRRLAPNYYRGRAPGALPRSRWGLSPALRLAARAAGTAADVGEFDGLLDEWLALPSGRQDAVLAKADRLIGRLRTWEGRLSADAGDEGAQALERLRHGLSHEGALGVPDAQGLGRLSWDEACQLYLALDALDRSCGEYPKHADVEVRLNELGELLSFPTRPDRHDSPRDYRREDVSGTRLGRLFGEVAALLRPGE